jgi:tetratricopeptide (TPR) repeat protein
MAKQRSQPRPKGRSSASPKAPVAAPAPTTAGSRSSPSGRTSSGAAPLRRSTYIEAVALYERGLEALQKHDFAKAQQFLESVLASYPEEKELHERVRLYLNVCQRQSTHREPTPQTVDERLYAATLALNGGQHDQAISHLRLVRDEDPNNDYALYMLAVAHAQRGEHSEALAHLERAIALNPENRPLAKRDPDLEALREHESFRAALDAAPRVSDRKRPARPKSAR